MKRIPRKSTCQAVLATMVLLEDFGPELLTDPTYLRVKEDIKKVIADFNRARDEFRMREIRDLRQKGVIEYAKN